MNNTLNRLRATSLRLVLTLLFGSIFGCLSPSALGASSVTLAWDANSETNLAGYKVHYGSARGLYPSVTNVGNVVTATISDLLAGQYFFVVTAFNTDGLESEPSNEVSNSPPGTPPTISNIADQTIGENSATSALSFQITDLETPLNSLTLSASSSNPTLVPVSRIVFGGSGSNRTVRVTPALNQSGTAVITITVTDTGGATASDSFTLTVQGVNNPPVILANGTRTIAPNTSTPTMPFRVGDLETPAANLLLSASSSNPTLVPASRVVFGGSGSNRTVRVTPAVNQLGTAVITLTVTDSGHASASGNITLHVQEENLPPSISDIADHTVAQNVPTPPIPFQVADRETAAANLVLSAGSSNSDLAPVSKIAFSGSGTNRAVLITPVTNQSGTAVITVVVTDAGHATASSSFTLTVQGGNSPPEISTIANQTIPQGETVGPIAFSVSDRELPAERLILKTLSSDPVLVPAANIRVGGAGTNRTITVIPRLNSRGTATITVTASDGSLVSEGSFEVTVRPLSEMPRSPLTVLANGLGTVEPRLNGSNLVVGKKYTLLARPGPNQLFSGWSGDIIASTNRLFFAMQPNLVLQANFVPDPFLARRGSYNGLFYETNEVRHESSGFFTLRLSPRGVFSARLKLAGKTLPFTGSFDPAGRASRMLRRPGTNAVTVDLFLDVTGAESRLSGQVTDGTWDAQLLADRAFSDATTNSSAYESRYTMSSPGNSDPSNGPVGSGYGVIMVNRKGGVRFSGQLGDSSPISQSVPLSTEGHWPFYVPLYSGKGSVLSWITLTNTPTGSLHGLMSWIKPARPATRLYPNGFTNELSVVGSRFRPVMGVTNRVLEMTDALLVLGGGNLSDVFTNAVTLVAPNKVLNASSNKLALTINPTSGMLAGAFIDPATKRIHPLRGVVLQEQRVGLGYVSGTDMTGFLRLEPVME